MRARLAIGLIFLTSTLHAAATQLPAVLNPITVPPGGTAQIQIFLPTPQSLISGGAVITLDPTIFGAILAADVYSATGDQFGAANITGTTVDIEFQSPTAGLGRIPSLPIIAITASVLPNAKSGATSVPKVAAGTTAWSDLQGNLYTLTIASGVVTIGGALSISSISTNGTTVTINGAGFTQSTTAALDGIALAATQFQSAQQLILTLAAPQDLAGHQITLQDPASPPASAFYTLHGPYFERPTVSPLPHIQPIFPLQLYDSASFACFCDHFDTGAISIQNPNPTPAQVTIFGYAFYDPIDPDPLTVIIPPGSTYMTLVYGNDEDSDAGTYLFSQAPVRITTVSTDPCIVLPCPANNTIIGASVPIAYTVPPNQLSAKPMSPGHFTRTWVWKSVQWGYI